MLRRVRSASPRLQHDSSQAQHLSLRSLQNPGGGRFGGHGLCAAFLQERRGAEAPQVAAGFGKRRFNSLQEKKPSPPCSGQKTAESRSSRAVENSSYSKVRRRAEEPKTCRVSLGPFFVVGAFGSFFGVLRAASKRPARWHMGLENMLQPRHKDANVCPDNQFPPVNVTVQGVAPRLH